MSGSLTINPAHLSDDDWETIRAFLNAAKDRGEVVEFSSRVELLTPAEVAKRLGMSRSTVLRRIADGDLKATKVGTHHRIPLGEFERYSHELMRRMAEASASDIEAELVGESHRRLPRRQRAGIAPHPHAGDRRRPRGRPTVDVV